MPLMTSEMDKENTSVEQGAVEERKMVTSPEKAAQNEETTLPEPENVPADSEMETETGKAVEEKEKKQVGEEEEPEEAAAAEDEETPSLPEEINEEDEKEEEKRTEGSTGKVEMKKNPKWRYLEEGEELVGALEMSPMVEGKRRRSTVDRLAAPSPVIKAAYTGGSGAPLSEESHFVEMVAKLSSDDLKPIHRILYGNVGKKYSIKKELRNFNGFSFKVDSSEYQKRHKMITGLKAKELQLVQSIFKKYYWPKENRKDKENYATELMTILLEPPKMEKKAASKKKPAAASKKREASGSVEPPRVKRGKKTRKAVESDEDEEEEDVEDPIMEEEEEEKKKPARYTPRAAIMRASNALHMKEEEDKPKAKRRQYKQLTDSDEEEEEEEEDRESEDDDEKMEADDEKNELEEEKEEEEEEEDTLPDRENPSPTEEEMTRACTEILKTVDFNTVTKAKIYEMICKEFPKMNADKRKNEIKAVVRDTVKKVYLDA